ncbi:MAG: glycoside hydrolase family 43 protein [Agriterribacter sp.]
MEDMKLTSDIQYRSLSFGKREGEIGFRRKLKPFSTFFVIVSLITCSVQAQQQTFTNPLLPSGADPFSFYKDGYYYYTHTLGNRITIWKTKNIADLKTAEQKTIYTPPEGTMWSKELWAPEIHFINNKWYVYYAADDGKNDNHRMYVLENASADPMKGEWTWKGKVADPADKWAIDGNVFTYAQQLYMIWSGWEGDTNGQQNIYIAKMKNPWTIDGKRVCISRPTYNWETIGDLNDAANPAHVNVNEGPQSLMHGDKLHIVFSASGCWTDFYTLGLLTFTGKDNLLDSTAWKKKPVPLFKQSKENAVYAPGHNSFFKSPDGTQDWLLYHANALPGQGCGKERSPRAQPFTWNAEGEPVLGVPVKAGVVLPMPSEKNR